MLRQSGVFPGCLGVPRAEKGGDCPGGGGVYTRQQLFVQRSAGFKALPRPLGLALAVDPQQITGVVAEEVGGHSHRSFHRRGEGEDLRRGNHLLSPRLFRLNVNPLLQRAVFREQ